MNRSTKLKLIMPFLYLTVTLAYFAFSWPMTPVVHHYAGAILTLISFILWIVARIQLGNSFSIGAKASKLVQTGLYSKFRHPVYYFSIVAVLGIGIYLWSIYAVPVLVALAALEIYRIRDEEKILVEKFGNKYLDYKAKTWL